MVHQNCQTPVLQCEAGNRVAADLIETKILSVKVKLSLHLSSDRLRQVVLTLDTSALTLICLMFPCGPPSSQASEGAVNILIGRFTNSVEELICCVLRSRVVPSCVSLG